MTGAQTGAGHTPTPWFHQQGFNNIYALSGGDSGVTICIATCHSDQVDGRDAEASANAERIVQAVNSHAEMLAALKDIVVMCEGPAQISGAQQLSPFELAAAISKRARTAIANAERAERHQEGGGE